MTKYRVISSKTDKWDWHFTKYEGVKALRLKRENQYQTEATKSVPATEKYENSLTEIKKTLKKN